MSDDILREATQLLERCRRAKLKLATAESCTGGLIAASLTEIAGSSDVVERGFVTYSNEAKTELVGVDPALIRAHGAVSAEVAKAMALGAVERSRADIAVAVTGIAGPGGATPTKPVGLVHLAAARKGGPILEVRAVFPGDRQAVRHQSVLAAFALVAELIEHPS